MTLTLRSPSSYNIVFDGGRDDGLAPKPSFSSRLLAVGAPFQHHPAYLHYQRRDTYQLSNHGWHQMGRFVIEHCYYRLNPIMEEIISLGDDLMLGLPSPIIPPEIASHVLEDSEHKLGLAMPFTAAKERATDLQSEVTSLERRRLEALNRGIAKTKPGNIQGEAKGDAVRKKWIFW
ncbi:hypothetical protein MUK42_32585 [Musa troglodytarum]|uniref:DUF7803 domain-containing protein n=1 Tax=Musa troglodytarum TaxID=320322 RepID=A0A9E7L047_9LILI|nr:hypothetical protein MUK42_32585 [Musa troglodytarum]